MRREASLTLLLLAACASRKLPEARPVVGGGSELEISRVIEGAKGTTAWGDVEYRWVSARSNRAHMARAPFVLTPAQGRPGWLIVQAHSSVAK